MRNVVGKIRKVLPQMNNPTDDSLSNASLDPLKTNAHWTNKDNASYYEKVSIKTQKGFSIYGGLEDYSDLVLIKPYLLNATSVLEVGTCYGRVLDYFIKQKLSAEVLAIERSVKFCKFLHKKFKNRFEILNADLNTFQTNRQFDVILWLWSGISDFAKHEQLPTIKRLISHLSPNGILILDTFSHSLKPANASFSKDQSYLIEAKDCLLYGYIPSPQEISQYAKESGMKNKHIPYETTTGRKRSLYILSKL